MRRGLLVVAACVGTLALVSGSAFADSNHPDFPDSSLSLTIKPPPSSNFALTLEATGSNAEVDDYGVATDYELYLFVADPSAQSQCDPTEQGEFDDTLSSNEVEQITVNGDYFVDEDTSGPFTADVNLSISNPSGGLLFCGYTVWDGLESEDAAGASLPITISGGGSSTTPGGTPPVGTTTSPTTTSPLNGPQPTGAKLPSVAPQKPAVLLKPKVSKHGRRLQCTEGTWIGIPKKFHYRWHVVKKHRVLAKRNSLKLTRKLRGKKLTCAVTAINGLGRGTASSRPYKVR